MLLAQPAGAQTAVRPPDGLEPLVTMSPILRASLARIAQRSALWRDAIESVQKAGRRAVILTSDQVVVADAPGAVAKDGFDPTVLAEVAPVPRADSGVDMVLVVINLSLLAESHRQAQSVPAEFEADLDRILVHEIYGHAVPYLLAGHMSGRCPDPIPGERPLEACSIQRENAVRAELGLGRRTTYGLDDLNLARRTKR
ncbi:MAG TPA: hypothetical protein VMO26_25220 [Vicinamibacterales bacterium]|nr:hypothetical protein [Vicinamibacterales bacterium]